MRIRPVDVETWLRLVDPEGPFFSPSVLRQELPHGFEVVGTDLVRWLREAYRQWCGDDDRRRPDSTVHYGFVRGVLRTVLGIDDALVAEGQSLPASLAVPAPGAAETLRPDLAVLTPAGRDDVAKARLLVHVRPPGTDLERPETACRWKVSPATRMAELLHGTRVRLGLVTNGDDWLLVNAHPGDPVGFATWRAWSWLEERETLQAFVSLLGVRRFFGVPSDATPEGLLDRSAESQQDVTERLGEQVRRAVDVLVQTLDRIDRDRKGELFAGLEDREIYEAALTVMMRLVFLFAAEERGLLRLGEDTWDRNYSVSTLGMQLREAADRGGEEVLERRTQGFARLLATFRAVHGGVRHEELRLPAYGGTLFDPDRHPFLEGRKNGTFWRETPASPLPIDDRTTLHLLEALQVLRERGRGGRPGEARRLSFRALDVELIGHVYEGLLDHNVRRADGIVLGFAGRSEPEIPLSRLEEVRAQGKDALVSFVAEESGRSDSAVERDLDYEIPADDHRFLAACDHDATVYGRALPFAGLVRDDTRNRPVVIPAGAVYVTAATDRRSTGTHYTPRALTEPIVQHTLDPQVFEGPAEGRSRSDWRLRSSREILALRVCDPAMGSGAFLVQACRYLSERLVESWDDVEARNPGRVVITPEGDLSAGHPTERPIPSDPAERLTVARRIVADRCLYGVDKNPIAVEMAKLSLWLVTLQKDRAFTFVDHALRPGDSLLGVTAPEQLLRFDLAAEAEEEHRQIPVLATILGPALAKATDLRLRIAARTVVDVADAEAKAQLLAEAKDALDDVGLAADLLVGAALHGARDGARAGVQVRDELAATLQVALAPENSKDQRSKLLSSLRSRAPELLGAEPSGLRLRRRPLHWLLEFPEVFAVAEPSRRGFDAIVGNPPFLGGKKLSGPLGTNYRELLVSGLGRGVKGNADLCAYFFLRASRLIREQAGFAMLATNTIAQGDTREVGLDQIVADGCRIVRAIPSQPWPGVANLEVAIVWIRRQAWSGKCLLRDVEVPGITPLLTVPSRARGKPERLAANAGKSFQGSNVLGMGFVLESEAAAALIAKNPRNRDVLFPYLNGEDLNSRPDQSASRWVINFRDWPLELVEAYPDCMIIVRDKVKPERDSLGLKSDSSAKGYSKFWWQYARRGEKLYAAIAGMKRVLVLSRVNNHLGISSVSADAVFADRLAVFPFSDAAVFSILQSNTHYHWAWQYSSTLRIDINYSVSDSFETFPFPEQSGSLDRIGKRYDAHRRTVMLALAEGLTRTYNRFHDPREHSADIAALRALHVEMDFAVLAAYGWSDLDPGHGFHEMRQGVRYTFSETARQEVLDRLLELNHQRHAEEVARGLHESGARRTARPRPERARPAPPEFGKGLFDD